MGCASSESDKLYCIPLNSSSSNSDPAAGGCSLYSIVVCCRAVLVYQLSQYINWLVLQPVFLF